MLLTSQLDKRNQSQDIFYFILGRANYLTVHSSDLPGVIEQATVNDLDKIS